MNPEYSSSVLFVKDIERSKKFYCDILGQKIEYDFGKNIMFKNGLSIWELNPKHHIPDLCGKPDEASPPRFEIYFETEDLDEITKQLKLNKVRFVHDIIEEPWGQRTVRFFDSDNHLIETGEKMKVFAGRIYEKVKSLEKTSERTGISIPDLKKILFL